jgi:hypothetical protein
MSLIVEIDSNGYTRVEFSEMRELVLSQGRQFNALDLACVPYEQLSLCATANAGAAGCNLSLIREEKRGRRRRFVEMSFDQFPNVVRYLQAQSMFPDVLRDRARRTAPLWENLSVVQKAWFKLSCVNNHIDNPGDRLRDSENLVFRAGDTGLIPLQQASWCVDIISQLLAHYPQNVTAETLRGSLANLTEELLQLMPEAEREVCAREELRDYSCTSDCFQPVLSGVLS